MHIELAQLRAEWAALVDLAGVVDTEDRLTG
jgi:hypothetical protein